MKSQIQVTESSKRYIQQYFKDPINSVGVSKIDICVRYKGAILDPPLSDQESDQDYCISVGMESEPADWAQFPKFFEDVRVFYQVIGVIRAL